MIASRVEAAMVGTAVCQAPREDISEDDYLVCSLALLELVLHRLSSALQLFLPRRNRSLHSISVVIS